MATRNKSIAAYQKRVERGMEWLDKNKKGWEKKIRLSIFDIQDENKCIVGQAIGDYFKRFINKGTMTLDEAFEHGFNDNAEHSGNPYYTENWDLLTAVWFYCITLRRDCGMKKDATVRSAKKVARSITKKRA